jgi:anaerobic dimethyl sulfoxide reductase subunit A
VEKPGHKGFDRVVRTVCSPDCTGTCGVNAFVKDDRIIKLEPAEYPDPKYQRICLKGIAMATERLHHQRRLTSPLIRKGNRGEGKWKKVTWSQAYDYIGKKLNHNIDRFGARSNAWINSAGNYGYRSMSSHKRVANCLGGTHFTTMSLSSDWAGYMGYFSALGEFGRANDISEIPGARYVLSVGRNMADTAHSEMHFLFDAMENGTKFVMVDPRFSRSAAKADEWVPIRPGTDTALALGMINVVINENLHKESYIVKHTNLPYLVRRDTQQLLRVRDLDGGDSQECLVIDSHSGLPVPVSQTQSPSLKGQVGISTHSGDMLDCETAFECNWRHWQSFTPEKASTICEIPAEQIRHLAKEYACTEPAWIWLGQGSQRYFHGHLTFRAWITLAALCGNIGKDYAGVNLMDGPMMNLYKEPPAEWIAPGGKEGHTLPGTRLMEVLTTDDPYPIRSLWTAATGFGTQTPFFERFIHEALPRLDLFAVSEQVMTGAAEYADVVLPCVSYYEDDWDLVASAESWFMQLRRRAVPPMGASRNDFDIYKGLCEHLGQGEDWQIDAQESCRKILSSHHNPVINRIDWNELKNKGIVMLDVERPYTPYRDMTFPTPSGRIELYQEQFVDLGEAVLTYKEPLEGKYSKDSKKFPFQLITYKHVHSTHATHTILPLINAVLPGPLLEISPSDALALSIEEGDLVEVFNDRGSFKLHTTLSNSTRPGVLAMTQGWWKLHFVEGHPASLGHIPENKAQNRVVENNVPLWDIHCNIKKVNQANQNSKTEGKNHVPQK